MQTNVKKNEKCEKKAKKMQQMQKCKCVQTNANCKKKMCKHAKQ